MAQQARDPVCGMSVDTGKAEHTNYQGKEYFFCSSQCRTKFEQNPQQYVRQAGGSTSHSPGGKR